MLIFAAVLGCSDLSHAEATWTQGAADRLLQPHAGNGGLWRRTAGHLCRTTSPRPIGVSNRSTTPTMIDDLQSPLIGSRMLRDHLRSQGVLIGRKPVRTLTRKMGIEAIDRGSNTSKRHSDNATHPCRLRNVLIDLPSQVSAANITYVPLARGYVYLFAVIARLSRRVLVRRLSYTMTADFCVEAVHETIDNYGTREIFHADQCCHSRGASSPPCSSARTSA